MKKEKIETPADIYDCLFNDLSSNMTYRRRDGDFEEAEQTLRVIEFLEKHLQRIQCD